MAESLSKTIFCRGCGRTRVIPRDQANGRPWGWYFLTVGVPPEFRKTPGKPYMVIGLFCSALCIAKGMPRIEKEEELHRHAYEHE